MNLWLIWLVLAVVCGILELTIPYFTFLLVAFGALAASGVSVFAPFRVQLLTFAFITVISLFVLRPLLLKRFQRHKVNMPSRSESLIGMTGELTEEVDPVTGKGRISIQGHDWAAQSKAPIARGKAVVVRGHDGIILFVEEV